MSDIDRENFRDERAPLKGKQINEHSDTGRGATTTQQSKKRRTIVIALIILVVIGIILAIALPLALRDKGGDHNDVDPFSYKEFNPYQVDNETYTSTVFKAEFTVKQQAPTTVQENAAPYTFVPSAFMQLQDSLNGASYKPVNPNDIVNSTKNNWAQFAQFNIDLVDNYQARIQIRNNETSEADQKKQKVSEDMWPRPYQEHEARLTQLNFTFSNSPFYFQFGNIYSGETILTTKNRKFLISDQYSEIGFVLPTKKCFGLGQRNGKFQLKAGTYTYHAKGLDEGLPMDNQLGGANGNHIHPFVLCQTAVLKDFFGMYFVGNAPQVFEVVQFSDSEKMVLNYITLGGPIEMYFIMRGTAEQIIQKYQGLVSRPTLPPYYALGVFQGSNSYSKWTQVADVFSKYSGINQALEGVFVDDYNQASHWSFTVDPTNYPNIQTEVEKIHNNSQHIIWGVSYALHNSKENPSFAKSIEHLCLIDSSASMWLNEQVTGILGETSVQYLDAYHSGMEGFLTEEFASFNATVGGFDGISIKDSHLPNDVAGEIDPTKPFMPSTKRLLEVVNEESVGSYEPYLVNKTKEGDPSTYYMPFVPNYKKTSYLDNRTISLNATQGGSSKIANLYIHNGVSRYAVQKSYGVLKNNSDNSTKRPLLFTDASWAGTGRSGYALITDIYRSWDNLKNIISQSLQLSMSGMHPMIDVCGSLGPFDEELCARWMQLASFMPMVRNYYNKTYMDPTTGKRMDTPGSEAYNFKSFNYSAAYAAAVSDRLKYSRYLYSQMYKQRKDGSPLIRALFVDYPNDDNAYTNVDSTYMFGSAIKVSPVLEQGVKDGQTYNSYFPAGLWIDLNNETNVINTTSAGKNVELKASFAKTNIHLKGGSIIPYQLNSQSYKTMTALMTNHRTGLKIARDNGKYAEGYLMIDDGLTLNSDYIFWKIRYADKSINFWVQDGNFDYSPTDLAINYLENIEILNAADLNETNFACYLGRSLKPVKMMTDYNNDTKILTIKPTSENPDITFKDIGFIKFGNSKVEPNLCEIDTAFVYKGSKDDANSNDTYWKYNLQSLQGTTVLDQIVAEFELLDDTGSVNVQITSKKDFDSGKTLLYRVPTPEVYNLDNFKATTISKKLTDFVKVTADTAFNYSIYTDASDVDTLKWRSDPLHLYFTDYFVLDSGIFAANPDNDKPLIGMGERAGSLFYKDEDGGIHTRYTYDQANPIDNGLPPGKNFYGYQPFYAYQTLKKDWFGVFDVNAYATDYILYSDIGNGETQLHKIVIGGSINKFFLSGSKVDDLIRKYQKLVGNPTVPPLWAFGWQQCRFGYVTSQDWWDVYVNYNQTFDLPLDVMWADIDYMDDYKLFTISNKSYADLPQLVQKVKADDRYFVPIMDVGVAVRENQGYKTLDNGMKNNVFIKQANKKDFLTAGVWCGNAYFPDFFKPETVAWWKTNFDYLYNDTTNGGDYGLKFDGIWLDENEATNFCNGYCKTEERPTDSLRNKPFYVPGQRDLEDEALGVDGWYDSIKRWQYDVHNLYPLMQSKATAEYLQGRLGTKNNARPYVLTRSNYPGIGKYAHHWMGDNWSTPEYLSLSVDGVYSYNLFGLPFMGSDICGFNGDAAPDVCTRWHQLGSLYPFSRNHNQNGSASQEPYRFNYTIPGNDQVTYTDIMKTALVNRYSLIKYYYSNFHSIGGYGGSFFKPLFYEFQDDKNAYNEVLLRNNILLGDGLKLSIQTQAANYTTASPTTDYYFPAARWCQIYPYIDSSKCWDTTTTGGDSATQTLPSTIQDFQIHIRGGYIIPYQNSTALNVRKTKDLEQNPTDLLILPNTANSDMELPTKTYTGSAVGYIYFDDGITFDNYNRFDLYLVNNDDSTFDLFVNQPIVGTKRSVTHETVGTITFLWASSYKMDKINKAQITVGGTKIDLQAPTLDTDTDTLKLQVTGTDGKTTWTFWDFTQITLSTSA